MSDSTTSLAPDTPDTEQLELQTQITSPSACSRHVVVTIPRSEIEKRFRKAYDELKPKAELPGFRPGKAPRKLVESRFKDQVEDQVKNELVLMSLQQVTEGGHFSAISEPDFDYGAVEVPADGPFVYEFNIEVRPDFETPNWDGMSLNRPSYQITDEVIDAQLARTLSRFKFLEAVDGPAQLGDTLQITAEFSQDGKVHSFLEETDVTLRPKLSLSDCVVEDFGTLMDSVREGESRKTTVKIVDTSGNAAMRGKEFDVVFQVLEVKRVNLQDLRPAVLEQFGFASRDELRAFVKEELQRQLEYHQQQALRKQITQELTKDAQWDLPERLVQRQTNRELQRRSLELRRSGFSEEQVSEFMNIARRNAKESTINALREHFVLEKIAEDLKIEPEADEYDAEINLIAAQSNMSERSVRSRLEKSGQMDALRNQIVERRVIDQIVAAGKVTDQEDKSFLAAEPESSAVQFLVAPATADLPEAKYDERPEDGQKPGATVKPTP